MFGMRNNMEIEQREKNFLKYLGNVSATTLSLYSLALRERIPKKLKDSNEKKYNNLFECLDINYLKKSHKRLLTNGDLYKFSQRMSNGVPSASVGKYIKFLEKNGMVKEAQPIYNKNSKIQSKTIGNLTFKIKTLLLKGVLGTGKSRAIMYP